SLWSPPCPFSWGGGSAARATSPGSVGLSAHALCISTPADPSATAASRATTITTLSLFHNMACSTPVVRRVTLAETTPTAAAGPESVGDGGRLRQRPHLPLPRLPPGGGGPGLLGGAIGHAVQPAGDLVARQDRLPLAGQDEEGRLEGVLGVAGVREQAAADSQ